MLAPQALAQHTGRRVVAYDRLGFGQSSVRHTPAQHDFIDVEAQQVLPALTQALGLPRYVLLGHSAGGGMALRAAGADATITTDNVQAGELACRHNVEKLGGGGQVVIINGPPVSATIDRVAGCRKVLDAAPGIRLLSADRNGGGTSEGGFAKMTDLLTLFPHIDAVFAINDPTAIGGDDAARQAGRSDFFIVGVDGAPKAKARMKDGNSLIAATVAQMPDKLAQKAVEAGYALIRNQAIPERTVLIPAVLLTRDSPPDTEDWSQ